MNPPVFKFKAGTDHEFAVGALGGGVIRKKGLDENCGLIDLLQVIEFNGEGRVSAVHQAMWGACALYASMQFGGTSPELAANIAKDAVRQPVQRQLNSSLVALNRIVSRKRCAAHLSCTNPQTIGVVCQRCALKQGQKMIDHARPGKLPVASELTRKLMNGFKIRAWVVICKLVPPLKALGPETARKMSRKCRGSAGFLAWLIAEGVDADSAAAMCAVMAGDRVATFPLMCAAAAVLVDCHAEFLRTHMVAVRGKQPPNLLSIDQIGDEKLLAHGLATIKDPSSDICYCVDALLYACLRQGSVPVHLDSGTCPSAETVRDLHIVVTAQEDLRLQLIKVLPIDSEKVVVHVYAAAAIEVPALNALLCTRPSQIAVIKLYADGGKRSMLWHLLKTMPFVSGSDKHGAMEDHEPAVRQWQRLLNL